MCGEAQYDNSIIVLLSKVLFRASSVLCALYPPSPPIVFLCVLYSALCFLCSFMSMAVLLLFKVHMST